MHWIAAVLAAAAVLVFLVAHLDATRPRPDRGPRWASVPLGLVLLTLAWCVQLIVAGGHRFVVD